MRESSLGWPRARWGVIACLLLLAGLAVSGGVAAGQIGVTNADLVENTSDDLTETLDEEGDNLTSETLDDEDDDDTSEEITDDEETLDDDSLEGTTDELLDTENTTTELLDGDSTLEDTTEGLLDTDSTLQETVSHTTETVTSTGSIDRAISGAATLLERDIGTNDRNDSNGSMGGSPDTGSMVNTGLLGLLGLGTLVGGGTATGTGAGSAGTSAYLGRKLGPLSRLAGVLSSLPWEKFPLAALRYSRYDDSDPLAHETRRSIYETIEDAPGSYLSAIEDGHDVSLSTIRHHVQVLEAESLISTEKQNGKRRYYPAQAEDVELAAALDEPARQRVLGVLVDVGEAHNGRIADRLDRDPSTVSHHLASLEDAGLVERTRDGRAIVNSLAPGVEAAYREQVDGPDDHDGVESKRPVGVHGDD